MNPLGGAPAGVAFYTDPSMMGYNPFSGMSLYNPSYVTGQNAIASQQATQAYQQGMLQNQSDQLAFQMAQAAYADAISFGNQYGYSPAGQWNSLSSLAANAPPPGTPTLQAGQMVGSIGYVPGYTGVDASQTMAMLAQQQQMAQGAAGMTGFYTQPVQSAYTPGTFLQIDPNTYPSQYGTQLDYVLPSGQLQRVSTTQARAMGWNGNLGAMNTIPYGTAAQLESAPPSNVPQQTLQGQQAYQQMNTAAQQQALAASQATGMYTAPGQILAPGTNSAGAKFSDLDPATQQAYYYAHGGDWQSAMNAWVADSNAAMQQAYAGQGGQGQAPSITTAGTPTETMAAQNQYFNQAQQLATMYGQYYTPQTPGGAVTPGTNAPTPGQATLPYQQFQQQSAMQYLQLLSQLQGPADYGQYLKVLGSTPAGISGLVGAAAGNYVAGGGSSGTSPQAQTLSNLVGAATGYAGSGYGTGTAGQTQQGTTTGATQQQGGTASQGGMNYQDFMAQSQGLPPPSQIAPQSFNNMLPSQQQTLGSMYSNLGYNVNDVNAMYKLSLPKYAAGSAAGQTRLV